MNVQFVDAGMASERLTHCCSGRPLGRAQLLAFAAIGVTFALPVQAQEAQKPITSTTSELALDEIVIEGDWLGESSEADAQFYPGARTILSGNDLHLTGNRNLEDALRKVPSVRIEDETGTGVLPNIGIRGLNPLRSERVMMLLDGIPLALAPYTGTGLSLFPATFETIERADIVRGGGAVHYGPNNVSGVIDLISKPISSEFSGTAKQRLIIDERTGNILSDSYLRFGGYVHPDLGLQAQINTVDGQAGRDHSETDVLNIMLDGEWRISDSASLKGRLQYYDVDAELPGALTPTAYEEDPSQS